MNVNHLAVIVPVDEMLQGEEHTMEEVWGTVTHLLLPCLGKCYEKFYPSKSAWGRRISAPFSVVLGKDSPNQFVDLYRAACRAQTSAIHFHAEELLKTIDPCLLEKAMKAHAPFCTVVVDGSDPIQAGHAVWQIALHDGALLPDCGVYYVGLDKARASPEEQKAILANIAGYALSMVTLEFKEETNG